MTTETILTRMMNDSVFADAVFADATKALAEYNLSAEEIASFKELAREDLSKMAQATPEERKSFGWGNHNETMS